MNRKWPIWAFTNGWPAVCVRVYVLGTPHEAIRIFLMHSVCEALLFGKLRSLVPPPLSPGYHGDKRCMCVCALRVGTLRSDEWWDQWNSLWRVSGRSTRSCFQSQWLDDGWSTSTLPGPLPPLSGAYITSCTVWVCVCACVSSSLCAWSCVFTCLCMCSTFTLHRCDWHADEGRN